MTDFQQHAPATQRNRQPILKVLQQVLPSQGTVLEISSGTGEHITFFAPRLPNLYWLPSEPQALGRKSIQAWGEALPAKNLRLPPLDLDVSMRPWPVESSTVESSTTIAPPITAIVNINMIHIAAWEMCEHLIAGAERILPPQGVLYLYGPFNQKGQHTAPSNEAFDSMLKERNPTWGIRALETVESLAQRHNFDLLQIIEMPANNLSVVFKRQ